jgi:glycosyltransferase involved in cell wall biosynthesis
MKIAHVVDTMDVGGAETLVSQMSRQQRALGHEVSVYTLETLGTLGEQMLSEGFSLQPNMGGRLPVAVRNFYRVLKASRPDVVHLHNPRPAYDAAMAARMAGVASIVSTRHSLVAPPRKLTRELRYAVAIPFCDWVVGICDATTDNLRSVHRAPAQKIRRIYNGAAPLSRAGQDDCPRKDGFTLLYVGRFAPVKNHALLLNAFRLALSSCASLRLWMVGDGAERKRMERLAVELGISSQVTFWGQQLNVAPFYSAADAFVLSSSSEGLPISLLQAFSLGLPALVTDVGGMAEAMRLAKAGSLVPVDDPAEMAAAILRMAENKADREQFSRNASAAFHAHFTLSAMVDAYMDLYRNTARAQRALHAKTFMKMA